MNIYKSRIATLAFVAAVIGTPMLAIYGLTNKLETGGSVAPSNLSTTQLASASGIPSGYFKLDEGIYGRWCNDTCSSADVIGNGSYMLLEVWARDRDAGDIYAKVNLLDASGTVIGWTNDTLFLSKGQKGVLTFSKYNSSFSSLEITDFRARGV